MPTFPAILIGAWVRDRMGGTDHNLTTWYPSSVEDVKLSSVAPFAVNTHDSLGEGLAAQGRIEAAIATRQTQRLESLNTE